MLILTLYVSMVIYISKPKPLPGTKTHCFA